MVFKQSVLNDVYAHGRGAPDVEVCGVLVGNVYQDAAGPYVFVEACIHGNYSAGRAAQVTFTAKTWSHIQDVMDRQHPDLRIVGWYHTHPGHGIFLSEMDLFIQKNFFSLPWHLAFVFDPQHQEEGLFTWRGGNMAIEAFAVQKDAPPGSPRVARRVPPEPAAAQTSVVAPAVYAHDADADPAGAAAALAATRPSTSATAELADLAFRVQHLERRQRWMLAGLALLVLVAVAWPIALSALSVFHAPEESPPKWMTPGSTTAPASLGAEGTIDR